LARKATGSEDEARGGWWTSLVGAITGLATLLTAVVGLIVALQQIGLFSSSRDHPSPAPAPAVSSTPSSKSAAQVDGVGVKILGVQRNIENGASFVDLRYSVKTGQDSKWLDPANFVRLIAGNISMAPVSTSANARNVPPESEEYFSVRFEVPSSVTQRIVVRFGEVHPLELTAQLTE
jgi:hypothetical protein